MSAVSPRLALCFLADGKSAVHTLTLLLQAIRDFLMFQQLCVYMLQSLLQHRFSHRESPGDSGCKGCHRQPPSTTVCSPAGSSASWPTAAFTGPYRGHTSASSCSAVCQAGPESAWLMACAGKEASCYVYNH